MPGSKEPYAGESWAEMMSQDEATIRGWFRERPTMNYGVCGGLTGAEIDLDMPTALKPDKQDGMAVFSELESEQEMDDWLCDTFEVETPSGGRHKYVKTGFPTSNAHSFPKGIDVRGSVGYVVGPGSILIEGLCNPKDTPGVYRVVNSTPPKKAPEWVELRFNHVRQKDSDQSAVTEMDTESIIQYCRSWLKNQEPAVEGAGGQTTTFQLFLWLREFGLSYGKALELIMEPGGWNERCQPLWTEGELRRHHSPLDNAYHYAQNRPGSRAPDLLMGMAERAGLLDGYEVFDPESPDGLQLDLETEGVFSKHKAISGKEGLEKILFVDDAAVDGEVIQDFIIPDWLVTTGFTALLAERGTGKTVTMVDMALRLACDMDWHGIRMDSDWAVVYICGEDDIGARMHMKSWCQLHGVKPMDNRLFFMAGTCDLTKPDNVIEWGKFLRGKIGDRRAVVFVDTWQRASASASQSDDTQMQLAVHSAEWLARHLGGPAVVAAHPPKNAKDMTVMGSSIIENSTTAIWQLTKETNGYKVRVSRIKGAPENSDATFQTKKIELLRHDGSPWVDRYERRVTGIVPERLGGSEISTDPIQAVRDQADRARFAYATVIRRMMVELVNSPEYETLREKVKWRVNDTSQRIAELPAKSDLRDILYQSGETGTLAHSSVRKRLTELFVKNVTAVDLGDGTVIINENGKFIHKQNVVAKVEILDEI